MTHTVGNVTQRAPVASSQEAAVNNTLSLVALSKVVQEMLPAAQGNQKQTSNEATQSQIEAAIIEVMQTIAKMGIDNLKTGQTQVSISIQEGQAMLTTLQNATQQIITELAKEQAAQAQQKKAQEVQNIAGYVLSGAMILGGILTADPLLIGMGAVTLAMMIPQSKKALTDAGNQLTAGLQKTFGMSKDAAVKLEQITAIVTSIMIGNPGLGGHFGDARIRQAFDFS